MSRDPPTAWRRLLHVDVLSFLPGVLVNAFHHGLQLLHRTTPARCGVDLQLPCPHVLSVRHVACTNPTSFFYMFTILFFFLIFLSVSFPEQIQICTSNVSSTWLQTPSFWSACLLKLSAARSLVELANAVLQHGSHGRIPQDTIRQLIGQQVDDLRHRRASKDRTQSASFRCCLFFELLGTCKKNMSKKQYIGSINDLRESKTWTALNARPCLVGFFFQSNWPQVQRRAKTERQISKRRDFQRHQHVIKIASASKKNSDVLLTIIIPAIKSNRKQHFRLTLLWLLGSVSSNKYFQHLLTYWNRLQET